METVCTSGHWSLLWYQLARDNGSSHWLEKFFSVRGLSSERDKTDSLVEKMEKQQFESLSADWGPPSPLGVEGTEEEGQPQPGKSVLPERWCSGAACTGDNVSDGQCAVLTLTDTGTFPTGFTPGPPQLLGDPFQGMRKPMSPVTAQVRLSSFSNSIYCSLFILVVVCGMEN